MEDCKESLHATLLLGKRLPVVVDAFKIVQKKNFIICNLKEEDFTSYTENRAQGPEMKQNLEKIFKIHMILGLVITFTNFIKCEFI